MLIYHPAYDAYHCMFRLIFILSKLSDVEIEKVKIIDFYLAFPSAIAEADLPRGGSKIKKAAKLVENEYHGPMNIKRAFHDMSGIQDTGVGFLLTSNLIDIAKYKKGLLSINDLDVPDQIMDRVKLFDKQFDGLYCAIVDCLSNISLYGYKGLKHRTGLAEYRYDTV